MRDELEAAAIRYHRAEPPGKIAIAVTKPMATQHDLALAYSPGVAAACAAIVADPAEASALTGKGNLVAVVSNGTAVLGLGPIGALAAKPVMEGKAALFKKFSGIDVFDIEIEERDPEKLIEIIAGLEATFGGINLEDIKAPECFVVERALRERMNIPVFHDDQHGTAIIVGAAVLNGLRLVGKRIEEVRLVASGAGAAALACLDLLIALGLKRENVVVTDKEGVVYRGREEQMDPWKARYAVDTGARSLAEVLGGADVFLGLSAGGVLAPELLAEMAEAPLVFALANPVPEIMPEAAKAARPDCIIATGRSDYPNQVNNVLCFPYIFRGALDVGATDINEAMKVAAVHAISALAMAEVSDVVQSAYGGERLQFGREYIIPKPFDPRLILEIAPAVAKAAMGSGVASRPIEDFEAYSERLERFVFRSGVMMKPLFDSARSRPRRLIYAEGEDYRVLQAVQQVVDHGLARPILIGRPMVVEDRIKKLGLRIRRGEDFELINPHSDPRFREYWTAYHELMERNGVTTEEARTDVRTTNTLIAALSVRLGYADAMLCGASGRFHRHLRHVLNVIGRAPGAQRCSTMDALILSSGTFFICDTHVMPEPSAEDVAEMALLSAEQVRRFGMTPKVALLSYSNFGSSRLASPAKMARARELIAALAPALEVEGEMHAAAALSESIRSSLFPSSRLKGEANILVMPNLDAANIAYNLLKMLGDGVTVGPILLGVAQPAHIMDATTTVRGIVNMSALAGAQLQEQEAHPGAAAEASG